MSEYKINILPFIIQNDEVSVSFSIEEKAGYGRIYKGNLPSKFPLETKESIKKFAWWSTTSEPGDLTINVNLNTNNRFAKYYFNKILYIYFREMGLPINRNFINDTEVYIEDQSFRDNDTKKFKRFS